MEYGVHAFDREVLKRFIRSFIANWGRRGAPVLRIAMKCCGEVVRYEREIDIPVNDVRCPCGNWFLKYDEQPFRVKF